MQDIPNRMGEPRRAEVLPPRANLATSAFFLDIDGTLIELAPTPDAVAVPGELPACLTALSARVGGALALVTGRSIETADLLMAPAVLPVAGVHGSELRFADGRIRRPRMHPALPGLKATLAGFVARHPGLILEDKNRAVAVHYRAIPEAGQEVRHYLDELVKVAADDLAVQPGKMVFEIRPRGTSKGGAIAAFLKEAPFVGRVPVFAGDDWTDESAFAAVNAAGGRSIRVGDPDRPTEAGERIRNPAAFRAWLAAHL